MKASKEKKEAYAGEEGEETLKKQHVLQIGARNIHKCENFIVLKENSVKLD